MKILQGNIRLAEYSRELWSANPEEGTILEDMLVPEYWAHVARSLKPGARIEVNAADKSWYAELYVRSATPNSANVVVLNYYDFDAEDEVEEPEVDMTTKYRGKAGWSVIRVSDKEVLFGNGETKEVAQQWIADNKG